MRNYLLAGDHARIAIHFKKKTMDVTAEDATNSDGQYRQEEDDSIILGKEIINHVYQRLQDISRISSSMSQKG